MTKRRGNNEGSLYQREDGTWRAMITLQGKRLSHNAKTRKDCQDWLKKTNEQVDHGLTYDSAKTRLCDYLGDWMESERSILRHTTYQYYAQVVRDHIVPNIGKIVMKDLRSETIQRFYDRMVADGASAWTVRKVNEILHSALEVAVGQGLLLRNLADFARPPKQPERDMVILNESQVSQFLVTCNGHRWEALFHLAIIAGMRQGELLALHWDNLDWLNKTIRVEQQLARKNDRGLVFVPVKTKNGKRTLTLGEKTIQAMKYHYDRQQLERITAGAKWKGSNLMFTTHVGGPLMHRNVLREFKILIGDAGLPDMRFQDLRHTAASLMLNAGVPPIVVSNRLGHSRTSVTLDIYGHLISNKEKEAAQLIDDLVIPIAVQHP